ncbi:peroxiredoxin-1-like [Echinops telfairi]|uniref:Peroxiredoxin-1-like n=1 Tax=Echinops telfairi TaxID=9371 RepID=A0AC55DBA3_ECHTE|nr:peroxiredoxin-1-like [Echinops telfairi]
MMLVKSVESALDYQKNEHFFLEVLEPNALGTLCLKNQNLTIRMQDPDPAQSEQAFPLCPPLPLEAGHTLGEIPSWEINKKHGSQESFLKRIIMIWNRSEFKFNTTTKDQWAYAPLLVHDTHQLPCPSNPVSFGTAKIGHPASNFKVTAVMPDGQFKDISLTDYKGKCIVFSFYSLDFTFVCPTEIIALSDRAEEFKKLNCQVIGASVDSHFCHLAWTNTSKKEGGLGPMNIPLVSDPKRTVAQDYGVLKVDEGISFRGFFIIDDKGILRQITVNDLPVGCSVDETLRLVQAFHFRDKHGEVCPAGWKPGSDAIKPDVQKSREYFAKRK